LEVLCAYYLRVNIHAYTHDPDQDAEQEDVPNLSVGIHIIFTSKPTALPKPFPTEFPCQKKEKKERKKKKINPRSVTTP